MGSPNLIPVGVTLNDLRRAVQKLASLRFNADSTPTFASMGLTGLTENALMYANGDGVLTPLATATNGQLIIGSTGAVPSVAALTGTANEIIVTNGAGSITLSLAAGAAGTLDHDDLINTHNLTTDIDHDQLTNVHQDVNTDATPTFAGLIPHTDAANDLGLVVEEEPEYSLQVEQALHNSLTSVTLVITLGATFTPLTGFTIRQAAFKLRRAPDGIGNLTMHLTETDGTDPIGGDLASVTVAGVDAIPIPSQDTWVIFTFDTPYLLTQDVKYAVFMTLDAAASNKYSQYYYGNQQVLDDSEYLQDAGSGWQNIPTSEGTFRIYSAGETEFTYTRWQDLFLSGVLNDGTVSLSVANAKAAYDFTTALNAATDGQLMIGDTGDNPVLATLTGTAKRVLVSNSTGSITLSGPQDIDTVDSPTFANLSLGTGELTAGSINRAAGTLTLEIAGTPELSVSTDLVAITNGLTVDTTTLIVNAVTHRVGIGLTDSVTPLEIPGSQTNSSAKFGSFEIQSYAINNAWLGENLFYNAGFKYRVNGAGTLLYFFSGTFGIRAVGPGLAGDSANVVQRFWVASDGRIALGGSQVNDQLTGANAVILANGNMGIGDIAPETLLEMTSTAPYLTLHNSTEENSDGGRESRINFKGEQDGTEETTLARIEVSHDGADDDEKGKFVISVNDGNDGNTPTDVVTILSSGKVGVGASSPNAPLEVKGLLPGEFGGFQSGLLHVTAADNSEFANSVITGHNSHSGNTQLWYLGSTSGSNNDVVFINRQNGSMAFRTSDTERFKIDADGTTHIGDGTNETQFSVTGVQTMAGTARVMKSVNLEPSSAGENPGGAAFPDDDYIDDFFFHRFDPVSEESVTFHWEIPHDYAAGGTVHLHNEFVIENPPSSGGNLNVRIGVEYKKISLGGVFDFSAATATLYGDETIVESETPFIIHQDSGVSFNTSGWVAGDVILIRLFREVGVNDTYDWDVTPSSDNDVWMFNHHLEYLCDKIGEAT